MGAWSEIGRRPRDPLVHCISDIWSHGALFDPLRDLCSSDARMFDNRECFRSWIQEMNPIKMFSGSVTALVASNVATLYNTLPSIRFFAH